MRHIYIYSFGVAILIACSLSCNKADIESPGHASEALTRARDVYVIAHMVNTINAATWAMGEGANALEMDMRFHDDGVPDKLMHGGICDCSCGYTSKHVCAYLINGFAGACSASEKVDAMMGYLLGFPKLALLIIDSKIDKNNPKDQQTKAGVQIIEYLERTMFSRGYGGKIIVGAGDLTAFEYLRSASARAATSPFKSKLYFSFDQMGDQTEDTVSALLQTRLLAGPQRVYGTGITSCVGGRDFIHAARRGVENEDRFSSALTYIWTLDDVAAKNKFLDSSVRGIMTNEPGVAVGVVRSRGLSLASPGAPLTDVDPNADIIGAEKQDCSCDYRKGDSWWRGGGCRITKLPPRNQACKCRLPFAWTCRGDLTACADSNSDKCKVPDGTQDTCRQGGGDCEGYK